MTEPTWLAFSFTASLQAVQLGTEQGTGKTEERSWGRELGYRPGLPLRFHAATRKIFRTGVVVQTYNAITREVDAGGLPQVGSESGFM